jgi:hypothetical protein
MISVNFWCGVLQNTISNLISGIILICIGIVIYKRLRKKELKVESTINYELKLQFIIREFKRIRVKYSKPLTEDSISSQVEQELSNLYGLCKDLEGFCNQKNISNDTNLNLLVNHIYAKKGVLYCNNPIPIADEKIPIFQDYNKTGLLKLDKENSKKHFYKRYCEHEAELKSLINKKKFFNKYLN